MNILISGGTGFIGINLVKKLLSQHVLILTREKKKNIKNIKYLECNLSKPDSYRKQIKKFKPEILIHLAWEGLPNYNLRISNINFQNSKNLIEEASKIKSLKKILISGSCFEGNNLGKKINEKSTFQNKNYFSSAKTLLKKWVFEFHKKTNVEVAWIRIFYAYGYGQRKNSLIPSLIKAKINQSKIKIKTPNDVCDFIYIDDVISFFKILIKKKFSSNIFNLGSGKPTKVINICKKILGNDFKNLCIIDKNSKIKNYYWADILKIKKLYNYNTKVSLDNGINNLMKNYEY